MRIIESVKEMQSLSESIRMSGKRIALVPTMGALHKGHLSLVGIAKKNADIVIMSIFVNPKQFGVNEDLDRYPRPFEKDVELAESVGVDYLFHPDSSGLYPDYYQTYVEVTEISKGYEGALRPGHFKGVATIVAKLFNITKPHYAVFGQKDAQQLVLIKRLVIDMNYDIEIIAAPIIRDENGLAMSSRNVYLTNEEKQVVSLLNKSMNLGINEFVNGDLKLDELFSRISQLLSSSSAIRLEYAEIVDRLYFTKINTLNKNENYYFIVGAKYNSIHLIDCLKFAY